MRDGKETAVIPLAAAASAARAPDQSEDAIALTFARRHVGELRYVAAWGKWFRWSGAVWKTEHTLLAFDLARDVCREVASDAHAKGVASAKTVAAVISLARADRRIAATVDQWDADLWLLNTPAGVVDLRTGKTRAHRPDDYLTKITAASPDPNCPIPQWLAFLESVTGGDADLQAFLQRLAGYALTGDTREHALFFLYGTGGNGKGVFLNTVSHVALDYATSTPIETFTASKTERHPTELADLRGSRLVTASETEEGRRWAESRIKSLTGGDPVKARFMKQDFFEYQPQFTLVISGNHKPGLRSVDEAIRRRLHLVPFIVTIPADKRDPELAEKLKGEWPGVLQWMIDGCLQWQAIGLKPPKAVTEATEAYLEAEDAVTAWIDECCIRDPNARSTSKDLFASWKAWADAAGEYVGSSKQFGQNLETRGFHPYRSNKSRGFQGLRIDRSDEIRPHYADQ